MNISFRISLLAALLLPLGLFAQQEMGLAFSPHQLQAQQINPAFLQDQKIQVGLPSIYLNFLHNGFRFRDLVQPVAGTDSFQINPEPALNRLRDMNEVRVNGQIDWLSIGVQHKGLQASLFTQTRYNAYFGYPKDLLHLAWYGNGESLGEALDIGPDFQARAWHEIGIGAGIGLAKRWRVGARLKYLVGLADISVERRMLTLTTQEEWYPIQVEADYLLRSSVLNLGNIEEPELSFEPKAFTGNHGMGIDVGAQFALNERLSFSAGIRDLGFIRWKDQAQVYQAQGKIYFEGLDVFQIYQADSFAVEPLLDSLLGGIQISQYDSSYTTSLSAQSNFTVRFQPLHWVSLGALIQTETYRSRTRPSLALHADVRLKKALRIGLAYSMRQRRFDNLGLYGSLKTGPIVTYLMTDNVLAFAFPQGAQQTNLRMGMNVVFGKSKSAKKWR